MPLELTKEQDANWMADDRDDNQDNPGETDYPNNGNINPDRASDTDDAEAGEDRH
jgi:hypothetical protein